LSFAPDLDNLEADENIVDELSRNDGNPLVVPEVNSMRSDLNQLIAMLEGQPEDEDFMPLEAGPDLADDLGLQQWLEEDEWEDEDADAVESDDEIGDMEESNLEDLD
jgi:hypothetical protein